jgi:hypothetical protein
VPWPWETDWNSPEYTVTADTKWRSDRFALEREKLLSAFSTVVIGEDGRGRILRVVGSIEPIPGVFRDFELIVPSRYPYAPPEAMSIGWECTGPHRYGDREMCLWRKRQWSPRYTLAYAVAKTFVWIHKHEVYLASGHWPGRQQPH